MSVCVLCYTIVADNFSAEAYDDQRRNRKVSHTCILHNRTEQLWGEMVKQKVLFNDHARNIGESLHCIYKINNQNHFYPASDIVVLYSVVTVPAGEAR